MAPPPTGRPEGMPHHRRGRKARARRRRRERGEERASPPPPPTRLAAPTAARPCYARPIDGGATPDRTNAQQQGGTQTPDRADPPPRPGADAEELRSASSPAARAAGSSGSPSPCWRPGRSRARRARTVRGRTRPSGTTMCNPWPPTEKGARPPSRRRPSPANTPWPPPLFPSRPTADSRAAANRKERRPATRSLSSLVSPKSRRRGAWRTAQPAHGSP